MNQAPKQRASCNVSRRTHLELVRASVAVKSGQCSAAFVEASRVAVTFPIVMAGCSLDLVFDGGVRDSREEPADSSDSDDRRSNAPSKSSKKHQSKSKGKKNKDKDEDKKRKERKLTSNTIPGKYTTFSCLPVSGLPFKLVRPSSLMECLHVLD